MLHHYRGIGHVVIVAGVPAPGQSYRADDWAKPEDRCSSQAQGIIVDEATVRLGNVQNSCVSFCPGIDLDEKSYYGVAHLGDCKHPEGARQSSESGLVGIPTITSRPRK